MAFQELRQQKGQHLAVTQDGREEQRSLLEGVNPGPEEALRLGAGEGAQPGGDIKSSAQHHQE